MQQMSSLSKQTGSDLPHKSGKSEVCVKFADSAILAVVIGVPSQERPAGRPFSDKRGGSFFFKTSFLGSLGFGDQGPET